MSQNVHVHRLTDKKLIAKPSYFDIGSFRQYSNYVQYARGKLTKTFEKAGGGCLV